MSRAVLALALVLAPSCLSVSATKMNGADLRHPVSFSRSFVATDGSVRTPTDADKVAHFERSWSHWGMLYDWIGLSSDADLSALLDGEIEKAGGDGIVNLKVGARGSGLSWLTSLLIVFPERVKVVVEGDVFRTGHAGS